MQFLWVFIGGGLGSISRYGIGLAVTKVYNNHFPLATFISNTLACLVLGITLYLLKDKLTEPAWVTPLVITGFCGGFSTFSTWSKETLDLIQQGAWSWALANILISLLVGVGLLFWLRNA